MPLLDESAELVAGDVKAVVVGVAIVAFHLLALNLNLSPGRLVGLTVEVTERDLENATAERIGGDFYKRQFTRVSKRANFSNSPGTCLPKAHQYFYLLCPAALLQGVNVGAETSKLDGTLTLYHSFLMKGWELKTRQKPVS
jgi:hypothetical protein